MHNRICAIDYGQKRVGIAISDSLGITAQPKPFIENNNQLTTKIKVLISDYDIKKIIIGNPLDTSGGETKKSTEVKLFVSELKSQLDISIELVDERFSTVAATKQMDAIGINRKKQRKLIDSQAAAFFLQGYLEK